MLTIDRLYNINFTNYVTVFNSHIDKFIFFFLFEFILVFNTAVHCDEIKDYFYVYRSFAPFADGPFRNDYMGT